MNNSLIKQQQKQRVIMLLTANSKWVQILHSDIIQHLDA